jgi:acetylornithine deacetylase/succinyl-diaminopimelate desuccinylase-like protein
VRSLACGAALAAAACESDGPLDPDAATDARPDAPPGCTRPALDAPWLPQLLADAVAGLAAAPRFTFEEREAARAFLSDRLAALGLSPEAQDYPGGSNVHATLPANFGDGGKQVVVGAHFDTVMSSPGANDNASGAAVVLAVARYLTEVPCRVAPVTVAFFDQEEDGLFGARAFAQSLSPAGVRAVHTIDQVAWDADGDRRFELERPTAALEAKWRAAAGIVGAALTATATGGTDHDAFRDAGLPAAGLTEEYVGGDTSPHRHTATDTPGTVNAAYHALAAQLAAQVILEEVSP